MSASAGFTTVVASRLQDATGTVVPNATIYFQPVDNNGNILSFRAGGSGGQVSSNPVQANVVNGAFTVLLADTTLTTPVNIAYNVTCTDNLTGNSILGAGYTQFQPSGSVFSFDTYTPDLLAQVTVQPVLFNAPHAIRQLLGTEFSSLTDDIVDLNGHTIGLNSYLVGQRVTFFNSSATAGILHNSGYRINGSSTDVSVAQLQSYTLFYNGNTLVVESHT